MRIALYRGKSWISKAIQWQTRGPYSHAAVILPDDSIIEAWHSPSRVRSIKRLGDGHTPGTKVDVFNVETSERQRDDISVYLYQQVGKKYDFMAILRFISRRHRNNPNRWFCSELVFSAFAHAGINLLARTESYEVSPVMLARSPLLTHLHYSITR